MPPAALRSHTYQPPSLVDLCEDAGLDANEAERWFVEQDVPDVDAASELTLGELQEVIGKRATVGALEALDRDELDIGCLGGQAQQENREHAHLLAPDTVTDAATLCKSACPYRFGR